MFGATVELDTFTVTLVVLALPAASTARAVNTWLPLPTTVESQEPDHEAVPFIGCQVPPSTCSDTAVTPTLSELEPLTPVEPATVVPAAGAAMVMVGGVVSAVVLTLLTFAWTVLVCELPDVSVALAVTVWVPFGRPLVSQDHDQLEVPVAPCQAPPSICTATDATDALSAAVPATVTVPDTVLAAAGDEMDTDGGVVSPLLMVIDSVVVEALPRLSVALDSSECAPLA